MYLTAQHVQAPATGDEGINAFFYQHGPVVWDGFPPAGIPDANPGVLEYPLLGLPRQGGNRVRSYLDVVAPDETPWSEIRGSFISFVSESQLNPLPWVGVRGRCFFRIGMESGLVQSWQNEVAALYRAAQAARIGPRPAEK